MYAITLGRQTFPAILQICSYERAEVAMGEEGKEARERLFQIATGVMVLSSVYPMPQSQQLVIPYLLFILLIIICLGLFAEVERS